MTSTPGEVSKAMSFGGILLRLRPRGLFGKYAITIVFLVVFVLTLTGAVETWIIYREATTTLAHEQRDATDAIANRIRISLSDLARQISFVTRASATSSDDHRADYQLLLVQVPAVAELDFIDSEGTRRIRVTRASPHASGEDGPASDAAPRNATKPTDLFGPVSFVGQEPYLPIAMAHSGPDAGMTIARVSLRALAPAIDASPSYGTGYTYVIDALGRVVGASKGSPIEISADLSRLPSVEKLIADEGGREQTGKNELGRSVIRTVAAVTAPAWLVVAEVTSQEAFRPIYEFLFRLAWLLLFGLLLAILAGLLLARRMTVPIQALNHGASQFAINRFDHRIAIHTGDELEQLARQFNRMADELAGSYGRLELQVEARTRDLAQSVRELKALEEIGRKLSSSLDLPAVLSTIVSRAMDLTQADAGAIYSQDPSGEAFCLQEAQGFPLALRTAASRLLIAETSALGIAQADASPISIADLANEPLFPLRDLTCQAGFRSALIVALTESGVTRGALVMFRERPGDFPAAMSNVMQTFAHQAVLAMHNARLYQQLKIKSRELEVADAHKTQFFANMSHELRTPLNAVLGYSELLFDGLYGELPERAVGVLDRIQINGKHLLGLINDVLDMTKMEAGALTLAVDDYSMKGLVEGAVASTESIARTKGLSLEAHASDTLPVGRGDDRRLMQVLLNLIGNALKFTDRGSVTVTASVVDDCFHVAVSDTGPGISADEQERIFEEFQQVDDADTRKKGGSGLGLSISRRLVAMHGGRVVVDSRPGAGATFKIIVPVRVDEKGPT